MLLVQVGYCTDRTLYKQVTVQVMYGTVLCRTVRYLLELSIRTVPYGTVHARYIPIQVGIVDPSYIGRNRVRDGTVQPKDYVAFDA
jgi:hypothetical protein